MEVNCEPKASVTELVTIQLTDYLLGVDLSFFLKALHFYLFMFL